MLDSDWPACAALAATASLFVGCSTSRAPLPASSPSPGDPQSHLVEPPADESGTSLPLKFGVHAAYWRPAPSGDFLITKGGRAGSGTDIDVHDDLDLESGEAPSVRFDVARGVHRGFLSYESVTWNGSSSLDRPVTFHGVRYPAGDRVRTDLTMDFLSAGYDYALVDEPSGLFRAGVGAQMWTIDASIDGSASGASENRSFSHLMPLMSLQGEKRFGAWRAASDVWFGMLASDRLLLDVDARIGIDLTDRFALDLGYRYWEMKFHTSTNEADLAANGPFLAMTLRF